MSDDEPMGGKKKLQTVSVQCKQTNPSMHKEWPRDGCHAHVLFNMKVIQNMICHILTLKLMNMVMVVRMISHAEILRLEGENIDGLALGTR
jgi:hypothetical protein